MTEKKLFIFGGNKVGGSLSFENIRADCWSFGAKVIDVVYPWFRNEGYRRGISVVPERRLQTWYIRGVVVVPERKLKLWCSRGSGAKVIDVVYPWFRNEGYRRGISVVPERRL